MCVISGQRAGEAVRFLALRDDRIKRAMLPRETPDDGGVRRAFPVSGPRLDDFVQRREPWIAGFAGKDVDVQAVDGARLGPRPRIRRLGKNGEVDSFGDDGPRQFAEKAGRAPSASVLLPKPA